MRQPHRSVGAGELNGRIKLARLRKKQNVPFSLRANIGLYRRRDCTAGRRLTEGAKWVDSQPDFRFFGKQAWTCYLAVHILNSYAAAPTAAVRNHTHRTVS